VVRGGLLRRSMNLLRDAADATVREQGMEGGFVEQRTVLAHLWGQEPMEADEAG